jgi:hypothetical protein
MARKSTATRIRRSHTSGRSSTIRANKSLGGVNAENHDVLLNESNAMFKDLEHMVNQTAGQTTVRHEVVTHALGTFCYRCLRARHSWLWRREWDSNPRYSFPHTRFPSVRLKPLGHLSGCPLLKAEHDFCK